MLDSAKFRAEFLAERDVAKRGQLMLDIGMCVIDDDGHLVLSDFYDSFLDGYDEHLAAGVPVFGHVAGEAAGFHRPKVIGEKFGSPEIRETLRDTEAAMRRAGLL